MEKLGCLQFLCLGIALRRSRGVDHSDFDSQGLQGREEELSEYCDSNLIEH